MALSAEERELWIRYRRDGDAEARAYLFERHAPWARRVAGNVFRRLRVPQMEWADFVQNASIGLLEAMTRFDPDKGLDFASYAKLRVQGATFNGVRVFLTGMDRAAAVRQHDRLEHMEAAAEPDPLADFLDAVAGLGAGYLLESALPVAADDAHQQIDRHRLTVILADALQALDEREREILVAHYQNHVPFIEIASRFGLTKGRISQIHTAALRKLRDQLAARRVTADSYL